MCVLRQEVYSASFIIVSVYIYILYEKTYLLIYLFNSHVRYVQKTSYTYPTTPRYSCRCQHGGPRRHLQQLSQGETESRLCPPPCHVGSQRNAWVLELAWGLWLWGWGSGAWRLVAAPRACALATGWRSGAPPARRCSRSPAPSCRSTRLTGRVGRFRSPDSGTRRFCCRTRRPCS